MEEGYRWILGVGTTTTTNVKTAKHGNYLQEAT
jgi:hypothetical protein